MVNTGRGAGGGGPEVVTAHMSKVPAIIINVAGGGKTGRAEEASARRDFSTKGLVGLRGSCDKASERIRVCQDLHSGENGIKKRRRKKEQISHESNHGFILPATT